jgi:photosystem II stability/assembly factor-like uncharacterized protein
MRWIVAALMLVSCLPASLAQSSPLPAPLQMEQSTSTASLRGIHAVGGGVAWASGTNGTVLRTEDAGFVWQSCAMPPGAEKLDFRGVWGWDAQSAIVMSSGPGDQSRLYKTTDGCVSWKLLLTNTDKDGFWDAIAFSDQENGYLLGDPVDGRFVLKITADGGNFWVTVPDAPEALAGSGAFAASNSSLVLVPASDGTNSPPRPLFGTGGSAQTGISSQARVYQVVSHMLWNYIAVPIAGANSASGVFSLAFRNGNIGMAVGGDYRKPNDAAGTAAWTNDGGVHWTASDKPPHGYRSAAAWDEADHAWVTAGTNGSDYSRDDGKTWQPLDTTSWNAISLPWFVGPGGRIGKLVSLPTASQKPK